MAIESLALYGLGAGLGAVGSFLGGQSQADAIREANRQNAALTRESWARDDNAVQRRTQDLIAAGLNPALAAGSAAGTSSPLPMQAAANTGPGAALESAGQNIAAWPTVEQGLKRSAAATLQAEASANLTQQQAEIARMDKEAIARGQDPRDNSIGGSIGKLATMLERSMKSGNLKDLMGFGSESRVRNIREEGSRVADADISDFIKRRGGHLSPDEQKFVEKYRRSMRQGGK